MEAAPTWSQLLVPILGISEAFSAFAVLGRGAAPAKLVFAGTVGEKLRNVAHGGLCDVFQCLFRQKCLMGGDNDIGHGDQSGEGVVLQNVA